MSRSRWALTEGCVPVSAVTRGAGKPVGLEEAARPGCLLDAVLSVTRLLWVVAATATALVLVPAPATARSEPSLRAQVATTQPNRNSHAPKASAGAGPVAQRPPARLSRRTATGGHASDAVLARGSGYDEPGGSPLVRRLQHRLALAGFAPGPVDGLYGPRTEVAVSRFQAATGLAIDGIAGSHTLAALYAPRPTLYPGAG
jgi:murein L,D-transpeptidase YcbB/YkuD